MRAHKCPLCDSRFSNLGALRTHCAVVHEKRRDHKCPICNSRFGELSNMKRHCTVVHEKIPRPRRRT